MGMWYAIAGITATVAGVVVFLILRSTKAGRAEAEVQSSNQRVVDANATSDKLTAINNAATQAPSTQEELVEALNSGKEGQ